MTKDASTKHGRPFGRRAFPGALTALPFAAQIASTQTSTSSATSRVRPKALTFDMQGTVLNFYDPMMQAIGQIDGTNHQAKEWRRSRVMERGSA